MEWLLIDKFSAKVEGSTYILTHWHADHYAGLSQNWGYGLIYCSPTTRRLLLSKYPKLQEEVIELQFGVSNMIMNSKNEESVQIRIFDSNHIAGSIMVLIQYKQHYYLHTGDMRFNTKVAANTLGLFTKNGETFKCKFDIEQLYLDNTYCDPIFQFPSRSFALTLIVAIITQTKPSHVYLCTDSIGKEEAFIALSRKYRTKIIVNNQRMSYIKQMRLQHECCFTCDQQGWIEVISKSKRDEFLMERSGSIAITMTGWANIDDYQVIGYNSYVLLGQVDCAIQFAFQLSRIGVICQYGQATKDCAHRIKYQNFDLNEKQQFLCCVQQYKEALTILDNIIRENDFFLV